VQRALDAIALPPPKAVAGGASDPSLTSPTAGSGDGEGATLSDTVRAAAHEMRAAVTSAAAAVSSISSAAAGADASAKSAAGERKTVQRLRLPQSPSHAATASAAEDATGADLEGTNGSGSDSAAHVQVSVSDADGDDEADEQQLVGRVLDGSIDIVDAFERQSDDLRDPRVWRVSFFALSM
jgi:hypothetical protein